MYQQTYPQQGAYSQSAAYPVAGQQGVVADPYMQQQAAMGGAAHAQYAGRGAPAAGMGDIEAGMGMQKTIDRASREIRMGFVRKVFGILSAQLFVTFGIVAFFSTSPAAEDFVKANPGIFFIMLLLSFGFLIALSCFPKVARTTPQNYLVLGAFTLCEGVLLGVISARYTTFSVMMAVGMTALVSVALIAYAAQTRVDFTAKGGMIMSLVLCFFMSMLLFLIFPTALGAIIYGALGALVFSLFLIYDTQLIIGGRHRKYQFSVDDYVFAALSLYLDVVNLFLIILSFSGSRE